MLVLLHLIEILMMVLWCRWGTIWTDELIIIILIFQMFFVMFSGAHCFGDEFFYFRERYTTDVHVLACFRVLDRGWDYFLGD